MVIRIISVIVYISIIYQTITCNNNFKFFKPVVRTLENSFAVIISNSTK